MITVYNFEEMLRDPLVNWFVDPGSNVNEEKRRERVIQRSI